MKALYRRFCPRSVLITMAMVAISLATAPTAHGQDCGVDYACIGFSDVMDDIGEVEETIVLAIGATEVDGYVQVDYGDYDAYMDIAFLATEADLYDNNYLEDTDDEYGEWDEFEGVDAYVSTGMNPGDLYELDGWAGACYYDDYLGWIEGWDEDCDFENLGYLWVQLQSSDLAITSITPSAVYVGSTDVGITIQGSGFGSAPTVNFPTGVSVQSTDLSQAASGTITATINVAYVAPTTVGLTVSANGETSLPSRFTLKGPAWGQVQDDTFGYLIDVQAWGRVVTYQVYNQDISVAAGIPISEEFSTSGWNCSNSVQPVTVTTQCNNTKYTLSNGAFQDEWAYYGNYYEPSGCGAQVVDHWQWCSLFPGGPPSPGITFMTLTGSINTDSSTIYGVTNPPNQLPTSWSFGP